MMRPESSPLQDEAKNYMERRAWADALRLLTRDILEHPSDPWSRIFLGHCHFELADFDAALDHFRAAAALAPRESTPVRCQGDLLGATGDWAGAGEYYVRADKMSAGDDLADENWRWWKSEMAKI